MLNGLLVAESLRPDTELCVESLVVTRVTRRDVSSSVAATQPPVWTFPDFGAEDEAAAYGRSVGVPEHELDWDA